MPWLRIMAKRIPPEGLEYLRKLRKAYGSQGGKTAAKNMTAEERKARAKKASDAAAQKRAAARLARERSERAKKSPKHSGRWSCPGVVGPWANPFWRDRNGIFLI